ncbi:vomeronasal type-1 receptor 3-like [Vombatus ursinus]|uniref:vomeronasal type-1 receptor 3-like n=1 Tax=Vombatus ursinus TaxID=29139 RepID=UPI000FFD23EA|nr:vomeronasal type-1 receptor 3-like [Vombatus ursinus]
MISHEKSLEIVFLAMLFFGIVGNMSLLYLHSHKFITGHRKRVISLLIINLAFAHVFMILFRGITAIINNWGWRYFLDDTTGKILNYFIRVTQGLSLCNTCLLSVFQAITISPSSLKWAQVKTRVQKYIPSCCILSWIFNLLLDIVAPMNYSSPRNSSNERWRIGQISFDLQATSIINILVCESLVDAVFVGLMICSSGYMVFVLHRHSQQVQHIHSVSLSPRASPETRATKAVLMLVITFVCFNSASSPFIIYIASARETRHWGLRFTVMLSLFYPIVSPFMLITTDTHIPKSFSTLLGLKSSFQEGLSSQEVLRKMERNEHKLELDQ